MKWICLIVMVVLAAHVVMAGCAMFRTPDGSIEVQVQPDGELLIGMLNAYLTHVERRNPSLVERVARVREEINSWRAIMKEEQ